MKLSPFFFRYPHPIQFYDELPGCNIGLAEFETLALERLRVLRAVEKVSSLSVAKYSNEWVEKVMLKTKNSETSITFDLFRLIMN
jgi:hypothetical protein